MEKKLPNNPRMSNPSGIYASEARLEDCVTLRDEIAMRVMQGHIATEYGIMCNHDKENMKAIALQCYNFADAMLQVREETKY